MREGGAAADDAGLRQIAVAAYAYGGERFPVPREFQPAFRSESVPARRFYGLAARGEGRVVDICRLRGQGLQRHRSSPHAYPARHAAYLGAEIVPVRVHPQGYRRGEYVRKSQVALRGHHGVEGRRDIADGQRMRAGTGDDQPREQGAVVQRRGHLTHAAASAFDILAVLYDIRRAEAPLFRARAHRVVERKLVLGEDDGAVDEAGGEGDVMLASLRTVAVMRGERGDEPVRILCRGEAGSGEMFHTQGYARRGKKENQRAEKHIPRAAYSLRPSSAPRPHGSSMRGERRAMPIPNAARIDTPAPA